MAEHNKKKNIYTQTIKHTFYQLTAIPPYVIVAYIHKAGNALILTETLANLP